ncbi:MAG: zinc ribbon domain-containing protein [Paracoccaceae bacterium]
MPTYEYTCPTCGVFENTAPISQFDAPSSCPTCQTLAPRNLLSVPSLSVVSALSRKAHNINERASDSPKRAKEHGLTPTGPKIHSKAPNGAKSMPSSRPWMLSH